MLYTRNSLPEESAHLALMFNAAEVQASQVRGVPRLPQSCMRCGRMRAVFSSIVVRCAEGNVVEAPLCGSCTRRMSDE